MAVAIEEFFPQQLTDRQQKLREVAATRAVGPIARLLHEVAGQTESR